MKTALITGASGGIGSAIARALAAEGWSLGLHYSSDAKGAKALAKRCEALGGRTLLLREDLLDADAPKRLVAAVRKRFLRLDLLVNNAGAVLGPADFLTLSQKQWDETLRLNLSAPFFLAREAFAAMRVDGGRIVNIGSVAAKFGGSARSMHYGAAKAGLEAVTVGLAREGASHGILVNTIRAGVIDTPFHGKFKKNMRERAALVPLKRLGRAEDVARMVLHLAGPGGDFITGQTLCVTGGE